MVRRRRSSVEGLPTGDGSRDVDSAEDLWELPATTSSLPTKSFWNNKIYDTMTL